ncbi:MAG: DUF3617 domain-containing protein [Acidobacteriota bacterium]|nr:DUF3617 domain-containing protein [Acidobacteriota bacterium]
MRHFKTVLPAIISFALAATSASGQVAPIRPGLWQVQMERETNGQKRPDMSERMKNMPPERRAQVEAALKQQGIEASGNTVKICQTREMLDASKFVNPVPDCKTTYSSRTNSSWKSHTSCSQNHLEVDSEIIFSSPESYTVKTTSTLQSEGQTKTTHMTRTGKWLSADCGGLKPLSMEK